MSESNRSAQTARTAPTRPLIRQRSLVVLTVAGMLAIPALLQASDHVFSSLQRQSIREIVHEYLLEHPEVILEAIELLREREQAQLVQQQRQNIDRYRRQLYRDPNTPVVGNLRGDVTVVEFFDYQCGFCKRMLPDIQTLLEQDRGVRLVLKEYPVLGNASTLAAQAALAARKQGLYWEFHLDLMAHRGRLSREVVLSLAARSGLDTAKLEQDMASPAIVSAIERNLQLGRQLGITGTPSFVIGDQVIAGAVGLDKLRQLVRAARSG